MAEIRGFVRPRVLVLAMGLCLAPSLGFGVAAAAHKFQSKGKDTLFRCLEKGHLVTLSAIVVQRGQTANCPPQMQFKVEQDKRGNKKVTTLQPLSLQGIVSIKDAKTGKMSQYYPDESRVIVQPAPKVDRDDLKLRMAAAESNYRFTLEKNGIIAGRETVVVTAQPKYPDMPARRYSIDVENDVLLRLETYDESGRKDTVFDTQAIWFPKELPEETFKLKTVGRVRLINVAGPIKMQDANMARVQTGIVPVIPRDLPFGFVVRDPQIAGDEGKRFIAVRITDGLLTATVYQWNGKLGDLLGRDEFGMDRSIGGLRIRLVGDLPNIVHHRLLDLFTKEAAKVFRPTDPEPTAPRPMLEKSRKSHQNGETDGAPDREDGLEEPTPVDEALMQTLASFLTALQSDELAQ